MRLLDLFCGAGGAGTGYHRAGFEVVGVDIEPMKDYPFEFHCADALSFIEKHGHEFDVIHASPPCQAFSMMQRVWKNQETHTDLIAPTRALLVASGKPWVMENVVGAPLRVDMMLCGTMFGLDIIRHRIFESTVEMPVLMLSCNHHPRLFDPWHGPKSATRYRQAMGIDWITDVGGGGKKGEHARKGTLSHAIPPAYTHWIGKRLMEAQP